MFLCPVMNVDWSKGTFEMGQCNRQGADLVEFQTEETRKYMLCSIHPMLQDFEVDSVSQNLKQHIVD